MLGVHYVMGGDMAGRTDSPLYGLFAIRGVLRAAGPERPGSGVRRFWIRQPDQAYDRYALSGMANGGSPTDFPRHGRGLRRRADPDLCWWWRSSAAI